MSIIKQTSLLCFLIVSSILSAQNTNTFLDRNYWKTNPTIEDIKQKISEGHSPSELNYSSFDACSYALIEKLENKTIKFLLDQKGNDVNKLTHDARTYIFWAAYSSNLEMMQYLLDKGAKTNIIDSHGYSLLNFAAIAGKLDTAIYDFCIAQGININEDKNNDGANALLLIVPFLKDAKLIDYFVSKGLALDSTDDDGNGIFNYASKKGNTEIMDLLIKMGVPYKKASKGNSNAMIFASQGVRGRSNKLETYQYLENLGISPNITTKDGNTPLHNVALYNKDINVLKYFISKGVNVNQVSKEGKSALINAVSRNSAEVVDFLLKNNADISIKDKHGNNLAFYLLKSFNTKKQDEFNKKLEALTNKGFDIKQAQDNGNSLFHLALDTATNLDLLKQVHALGIAVNTKNKNGITPLQKAAMKAKDDTILKYLLSIGANKTIRTDFDESVYDLAEENEALHASKIDLSFLK